MALIEPLFPRCRGNVVRLQESLSEEYPIEVAYRTLTRWVREARLRPPKRRAGAYHVEPGQEMPQDPSPLAPERVAFGKVFGLTFRPHAVGHADRKARVERPFAYVEGNFLAGRTCQDWPDLNAQARAWCQQVANAKAKRALGMSPEAA